MLCVVLKNNEKPPCAVADLEYHKKPRKVEIIKINDAPAVRHDNQRLTHSVSELSGFPCTSSLTMNEKF